MPGSSRPSRASAAAAAALALAVAALVAATAPAGASAASLWAYVDAATVVRATPAPTGRAVGRLGVETYLGSPETVVVLAAADGWTRIRYPGIGPRTGWVRSGSLAPPTATSLRLVVDRRAERLTLYDHGRVVRSARVGVGAPGSPTPAGRTYVREEVVPTDPHGTYGPVAFGLGAFSSHRTDWPGGGQVGVHGTDEPELVPGRISNGCVRLTNPAVVSLARRLEVGTPVLIR